jgi:2-phosphosulfolactate phosphatase
MIIDAVLTPAEIALLPQRDLSGTTCVVFDVLRATSSMITALAHGAAEIHPACTIDEALALKERMPEAILGGERNGDPIAGFDVGNSPLEYRETAGRRIITTTTNGTVALRACGGAQRVLVGAILNLEALAAALRDAPRVLLVGAGTFETLALEDVYAAGLLLECLPHSAELTDAAVVIQTLVRQLTIETAVFASRNGRALQKAQRGADVEWCAQPSRYSVVGQMSAGVIRPLTA